MVIKLVTLKESYDNSFIVANKHREMALFSGFTGERAERTWASRMRVLADLGFIGSRKVPTGRSAMWSVLNPYNVVLKHFETADQGQEDCASENYRKSRIAEMC